MRYIRNCCCTCTLYAYAKSLYNLFTEKKTGTIIVVGSTTPPQASDSQPRQKLTPPPQLPSLCPPEPDHEWFKNNESICLGAQSPPTSSKSAATPSSPPPVTPSSPPPVTPSSPLPVTPSSLPPATLSPSPSLDQSNSVISESGMEFNFALKFF